MASSQLRRTEKVHQLARDLGLRNTCAKDETRDIRIENCIGFSKVPVGLAGPLHVTSLDFEGNVYAPLATYEATLVASCSRGCKVFNLSGGVQFEVLGNGMSRAPVFVFKHPEHAIAFTRALPTFRASFSKWAEATSGHIRLQEMRPTVIGSHVHVFCSYHTGSAAGQNMVTKATQYACDMLRNSCGKRFSIQDFFIEGQLSSDKKPSWGNVKTTRGVEVLVWGTITPSACQTILGCSTQRLYWTQQIIKDGGIRNGQFGANINTANIFAAMFISTGQDPGSTAEAAWSHLTSELDSTRGILTMSLYVPSLPVGTVGGGTGYSTQKEALSILNCGSPGTKNRLAGMIASFALALDASTSAAIANNTFTESHMRFARGGTRERL